MSMKDLVAALNPAEAVIARFVKAVHDEDSAEVDAILSVCDDKPRLLLESVNNREQRALMFAAENAALNLIDVLLAHGADPLFAPRHIEELPPLIRSLKENSAEIFFRCLPFVNAQENPLERESIKALKKGRFRDHALYKQLSAFRQSTLKKHNFLKASDLLDDEPGLFFFPLDEYGHTLLHLYAINYSKGPFSFYLAGALRKAKAWLGLIKYQQLLDLKDAYGLTIKDYIAMQDLTEDELCRLDLGPLKTKADLSPLVRGMIHGYRENADLGSPFNLSQTLLPVAKKLGLKKALKAMIIAHSFNKIFATTKYIGEALDSMRFKQACQKDNNFFTSFIDALSNEQLREFSQQICIMLTNNRRGMLYTGNRNGMSPHEIKVFGYTQYPQVVARCYQHGLLGFRANSKMALKFYLVAIDGNFPDKFDYFKEAMALARDCGGKGVMKKIYDKAIKAIGDKETILLPSKKCAVLSGEYLEDLKDIARGRSQYDEDQYSFGRISYAS